MFVPVCITGRHDMKGKCVLSRNKKFIEFFVTISVEFIVI